MPYLIQQQEEEPRPPSLYQIVLGMLSTSPHILEGEGKHIIEVEGYGTLEVEQVEDEHHFTFTDMQRLFVLRPGQELVEKVSIPKSVVDDLRPDPVSPEDFFRMFIRDHSLPDKEGETIVILYGEEEDKVCLLTRTNRGIIGDFVNEETKLFYDLNFRTTRSYADVVASEKRLLRLQIEKEKQRLVRKNAAVDPVDQLDYDGETEIVDRAVYKNRIVCECGNVRYVKQADLFEVKRCKPCQREWKNSGKGRKRKRKEGDRAEHKNHKA